MSYIFYILNFQYNVNQFCDNFIKFTKVRTPIDDTEEVINSFELSWKILKMKVPPFRNVIIRL